MNKRKSVEEPVWSKQSGEEHRTCACRNANTDREGFISPSTYHGLRLDTLKKNKCKMIWGERSQGHRKEGFSVSEASESFTVKIENGDFSRAYAPHPLPLAHAHTRGAAPLGNILVVLLTHTRRRCKCKGGVSHLSTLPIMLPCIFLPSSR